MKPLFRLALPSLIVAISPAALFAQDTAQDREMLAHIRLLEQMLRDAGVDPPQRPGSEGLWSSSKPKPIVDGLEVSEKFTSAVREINERSEHAPAALRRIRVWLNRGTTREQREAGEIILAVHAWADEQLDNIEQLHTSDPVAAYGLAEEAIQTLGHDALAKPFHEHLRALKSDPKQWSHIESTSAYRRVIAQAESIGLTGDWQDLDFQNGKLREAYRQVRGKMKLVGTNWPGTEAAQLAKQQLDRWQRLLEQAEEDLPAWRYTCNFALIHLGTKKTTVIQTDTEGRVTLIDKERALYDPRQIVLYGTFQNTSDKAHRYTFIAGASRHTYPGQLKADHIERLAGYSLIETPRLGPGEVYHWRAEIAVNDSSEIKQAGITKVEAIEPGKNRR